MLTFRLIQHNGGTPRAQDGALLEETCAGECVGDAIPMVNRPQLLTRDDGSPTRVEIAQLPTTAHDELFERVVLEFRL